MDSISFIIRKDSNIDCGKVCSEIQQLIVRQLSGVQSFEKIIRISLHDVIEVKEELPKLTYDN